MSHIVLLGDSVFDNAAYVPGQPAVVDQLRQHIPRGWRATLLAIDGSVAADVARQVDQLPADATHLIVSTGGNDALGHSGLLQLPARSVAEVLAMFSDVQSRFRNEYRDVLQRLAALSLPTLVCTIYDAIPGLEPITAPALSMFNDVIVREAAAADMSIVDLRGICIDAADFSAVSPIEPSAIGGDKIARVVAAAVRNHDFSAETCAVLVR